jgi:hypothetical protein
MKSFVIFTVGLLLSNAALAKSLQDVISQYSTVETISPVEINGNPVSAQSAMAICKMAGYSLMLESVATDKNLKRGSKLMYLGETSVIYLIPQEILGDSKVSVLERVTCAK